MNLERPELPQVGKDRGGGVPDAGGAVESQPAKRQAAEQAEAARRDPGPAKIEFLQV